MSVDSSIIEKIRKLRAMTVERGATEDEAISAQTRRLHAARETQPQHRRSRRKRDRE
jgi:hypothetical protein